MNGNETLTLLYLARNLYPRDKSMNRSDNDMMAMAKTWSEMLKDIPFDLGKAALAAHAASSPYAPAISEIRAYARRMTEPPRLSPDEAWSLAHKAMTRHGCSNYKSFNDGTYPWERAKASVPPEVWHIMELMGYRSMCMSENIDAVRAQFIRAWERQQKAREERENLLPFLPEGLKEKFLALNEGAGK